MNEGKGVSTKRKPCLFWLNVKGYRTLIYEEWGSINGKAINKIWRAYSRILY